MSDLNDFFAKKDRKKKKAAAKSAMAATTQETKPVEAQVDPDRVTSAPPQNKQPDDGWIEIEDPKGSQVNTGGRTVVEFRRDAEEKEVNGDGGNPTEKFSGWGTVGADTSGDTDGKDDSAAEAPRSAFPTLADAAKVKTVPASIAKQSYTSGMPMSTRRPRFIGADPEKLRQKMKARAAAQPK